MQVSSSDVWFRDVVYEPIRLQEPLETFRLHLSQSKCLEIARAHFIKILYNSVLSEIFHSYFLCVLISDNTLLITKLWNHLNSQMTPFFNDWQYLSLKTERINSYVRKSQNRNTEGRKWLLVHTIMVSQLKYDLISKAFKYTVWKV